MAVTDSSGGGRPRAKTMVGLDVHNAYARLGVSPLLSTDEIKEIINRKRKELMRQRRTRADQKFGEEDAGMTSLQAIEDEIGTAKARARYDRVNPQNLLLTVQPAPGDAGLDPEYGSGLVTAWLIEELGRERRVPSAEDLSLWAPHGLDPEIIDFLAGFAEGGHAAAVDRAHEAVLPEVAELERIGLDLEPDSALRPAGEASKNVLAPGEREGGLSNG